MSLLKEHGSLFRFTMSASASSTILRCAVISDTHGHHQRMSKEVDEIGGDVLIHAGDACVCGSSEEVFGFLTWFVARPFAHLIFVPGNHDLILDAEAYLAHGAAWIEGDLEDVEVFAADLAAFCDAHPSLHILTESATRVEIEGVVFGGSPAQPRQPKARPQMAWGYPRGSSGLRDAYACLPDDAHVIITHTPPLGIMDATARGRGGVKAHGCADLMKTIKSISPSVHVFGHIHQGYGVEQTKRTLFINAATCTAKGSIPDQDLNPVIVFGIDPEKGRNSRSNKNPGHVIHPLMHDDA